MSGLKCIRSWKSRVRENFGNFQTRTSISGRKDGEDRDLEVCSGSCKPFRSAEKTGVGGGWRWRDRRGTQSRGLGIYCVDEEVSL